MKCLELQELCALEALGALDRAGQVRLTALLAADPDAAAEMPAWRDAVAAFAAASVPRRKAPAHLRERILTRIRQTPQLRPTLSPGPASTEAKPEPKSTVSSTSTLDADAGAPAAALPAPGPDRPAMTFDFSATATWMSPPALPGVRVRVLAVNQPQGYRVLQVELAPGAGFPAHHHGEGPEDLFVLTGDLVTEGRTLGPGDHFHAEPGTEHRRLLSPSGCQALLVEPLAGPKYRELAAVD